MTPHRTHINAFNRKHDTRREFLVNGAAYRRELEAHGLSEPKPESFAKDLASAVAIAVFIAGAIAAAALFVPGM